MRILEMSLQASAIVLLAALLRGLAGRRLPRRGFVALWLLAAARMLLPGRLPFRYGAAALLLRAFPALRTLFQKSSIPQIAGSMTRAIPAARGASFALNSGGTLAAGAANASTLALDGLLRRLSPWRVAWLAGLILCALALLLPHLRWRRVYARSLPLEDAGVDAWLREHPLRLRRIRVRTSDEIPAPLTYGLLRPVILLPSALDRSDAARLHPVLLHEFTHIRRFDLLSKLALAAALCAHWFNPLAWLMYLLANRDIELACDEAALCGADEPARRRYAKLLLELAARQSGLPNPLASGFDGRTIEERIGAIMNHRQTSKFAVLLAALLVLFAALGLATSAEEAAIPPNPEMEALIFDGWEEVSVRDYAAIISALPEIEDPNESGLPGGYLQYIYYPLLRAEFDSPQTFSGGSIDAETGEALMNYEVTATITAPDRLTVGELRDALRGVRQGLERFDCESATQDDLQAYVMDLAERWSDGESIVFDILAELPGSDSPYADAQTLAHLAEYAPLGLEYDCSLGNLSMRYRGEEIRAVIDAEAQITISNSAGAEGLGGEGPFLLVEYEDGEPAALRPISPEAYAALPAA